MRDTRPDDDPQDPQDPRSSEDAAWRAIVENFGERAELDPQEDDLPVAREAGPRFRDDVDEGVDEDVDESVDGSVPSEQADEWEHDRFVPPTPEPLRLSADRAVAWAGVLGAPVVALVAAFVVQGSSVSMPPWLGLGLALAFLGGFGYLVATMPKQRDDPWDDGARL